MYGVAMYECIFRILENTLGAYDKMGIHRQRMGNITPGFYPDDMFETSDGKWVVLSAVSDQQFAALCGVIGRAELVHDPAFATPNDRGRQVERLQSVIGVWVRAMPSSEVVAQLEAARVPCALVMGINDIVEDPHYRARNAIIEVEDPQYGTLKHPAVTPRLSHNPGAVHRGAPTIGADTDTILRDILALSEADIAELHRQQIV